jgi:O-acetyl-ADP-ribose deacetylase (regulator of RNase III)
MHLILFDLNDSLAQAWNERFDLKTDVVLASFDEVCDNYKFDAFVSPANSFGIMDGGIDGYIAKRYPEAVKSLHMGLEAIGGYLPVGNALPVLTLDDDHPWMISAPTMEYPKRITDPMVVYNVMRSILQVGDAYNSDFTIAIPGLGTATGGIAPGLAAHLMWRAWEDHQRQLTPDWKCVQEWASELNANQVAGA